MSISRLTIQATAAKSNVKIFFHKKGRDTNHMYSQLARQLHQFFTDARSCQEAVSRKRATLLLHHSLTSRLHIEYWHCCIDYASAKEQVSDPHSAEKKENHIVEV
jgi:hypothetical protein